MMEARDELRVEIDNMRTAAEWAVAQWSQDDARAALSSLDLFFWAHSWHEGSDTFGQLAELLGPSPGSPLEAAKASDVMLSALAYQTYLGSALGYDERLDAIARACLPVLRERRLTRELGVCLLAIGTNDCYRDVYAESAVSLEEAVDVARSAGDHFVVTDSLAWLGFVRLLVDDLRAPERRSVPIGFGRARGPLMPALNQQARRCGEGVTRDRDPPSPRARSFLRAGDDALGPATREPRQHERYCVGDYEQAMEHALAGYGDSSRRITAGDAGCPVLAGFALRTRTFDEAQVSAARWSSRGDAGHVTSCTSGSRSPCLRRKDRDATEVLFFSLGTRPCRPPIDWSRNRPHGCGRSSTRGAGVGARRLRLDLDELVSETLGDRVR
jgi:hypothetical protein